MKTNKPSLRDLFAAHSGKVSDKWDIYISEYDRLFQPYRDQPVRLLEIGIQNGGSLEVWSKYFAKAKKIVGSDIDLACEQLTFDDPKIAVVVADANTDDAEKRILAESNAFDLIIDDGSHRSGDIVRSFARYFKHLADGGLYIAEDLHCSYWQDFEGGIFQPYSSIAFFKRLADTVNYEHWGVDKTRIELLDTFSREYHVSMDETTLANVHSVEFINSMCVIKKASPIYNVLGQRFIAGTQAVVDTAPLPLHGTLSAQRDQTANAWSSGKKFPEDEVQSKKQEVEALTQTIGNLNRELVNTNAAVSAVQQSKDEVISSSANRVDKLITQIAERERVFVIELSKLQQSHDTAIENLVEQYQLREKIYIQDLSKTRSEKEAQLLLQAKREKEFLEKIEDLQKLHENLMQAQAHQHTEQNNLTSKNLEEARRLLNENTNQAVTREIAHSEKREALQALHAAQITGHLEAHAIEQKAFLVQLTMLQAEALKLREHADMQVKEDHLKISTLKEELGYVTNTRSWRWTSPLRKINRISAQSLGASQAENLLEKTAVEIYQTSLGLVPATHNQLTNISNRMKENTAMSNNENSMLIGAVATSFSELIAHEGESFIHCAYKTLLARDPDSDGFKYYLSRLQSGIDKVEIISQIALGKEGQSKQIEIFGLKHALKQHKLGKVPVIGNFITKSSLNTPSRIKIDKAKIACIIPFYNGSAFIERALNSVLKQTVPSDEVIVVNDGSQNSESEFLNSLGEKYNIKIINKKNGGQGSARNAGVMASSSKYICFLDQDDFYLPKHNEILLRGVPVDEPDFGWVYADLREADGDGLIVRMSMVKEHSVHPKHSLIDLIRNDLFVLPSASLINSIAYRSVGGFDEQFTGYEDDDLFLRLFRNGWSNTFVDKPVTVWCIHGESTSYSVKMSRSRFRYLKKLTLNYPDDILKSRFYFRDLMIPRFGSLIVSDAVAAKNSNSKDKTELLDILSQYYELVQSAPGVSNEYLSGLTDIVSDLLS